MGTPRRQAGSTDGRTLLAFNNCLTAAQICSTFVLNSRNRGVRVSDPIADPEIRGDRAPAARSVRSEPEKSERERRVVEGLKGGVSMAEIARQEGITERGLRKYVRTLFARRAPEATGEFIATQMNRLNEALLVSFGAMSAENLPAVDRVVKIVRELDRYQGLSGGARGTAARRKLLESLSSGAETDSSQDEPAEDDLRDALADTGISFEPPPQARVIARSRESGDVAIQGPQTPNAHLDRHVSLAMTAIERPDLAVTRGTGTHRNSLESLDPGAGTIATPSPTSHEDWGGEAQQASSVLMSGWTDFLAGLAPQGMKPGEGGT
jgi:DNA-binding CsgD family transcriptional regulator